MSKCNDWVRQYSRVSAAGSEATGLEGVFQNHSVLLITVPGAVQTGHTCRVWRSRVDAESAFGSELRFPPCFPKQFGEEPQPCSLECSEPVVCMQRKGHSSS